MSRINISQGLLFIANTHTFGANETLYRSRNNNATRAQAVFLQLLMKGLLPTVPAAGVFRLPNALGSISWLTCDLKKFGCSADFSLRPPRGELITRPWDYGGRFIRGWILFRRPTRYFWNSTGKGLFSLHEPAFASLAESVESLGEISAENLIFESFTQVCVSKNIWLRGKAGFRAVKW